MEALMKFDRYCFEMQNESKFESIHSSKMAVMRKKLRKMLVSMFTLDEDISKKIEVFWKVAYYLPTNRALKNTEDIMDTNTLLTIFCGELHELLACSDKDTYSSYFNLYLGDLHRYMAETDIQRKLSLNYYARSIELDQRNGRGYNMMALLEKSESSEAILERMRLFFRSLLAEKPYNSESNILEMVENIQLADKTIYAKDTEYLNFLAHFVHWCLFEKSSRSDHNNNGTQLQEKFDQFLKESENLEKLPELLLICGMASIHAKKAIGNDRYIHCFEVLCDMIKKLLSLENLPSSLHLLIITCEWISMTCAILSETIHQDSKPQKFLETFPIYTKNKWEKLCDIVSVEVNKFEKEIKECLENESDQFLNEDIYYKIKGHNKRNHIQLLTFWSMQICVVSYAHFEICEGSCQIIKRVVHSRHKTLDMPQRDEKIKTSSKEELDNSNWKPIYILFDYPSIMENFETVKRIWQTDEFINSISSKVLAKLDHMKTNNPLVRRAIREIHLRQKNGKIRIITGKDDESCCRQLIKSAKESGLKGHEEVVAILVNNVDNYTSFNMKEISETERYELTFALTEMLVSLGGTVVIL